jgi:hypothetical protein
MPCSTNRTRSNVFNIPEIIFDPTLVLSPHVFLLGMLFKIQAFRFPSIDSPERLYSLNVLKGLNEQVLPLRKAIDDDIVFCQAVREAYGVRIAHELQLTSAALRYLMKKGDQITGFAQVTKLYNLRDGAAKAFNESRKCPVTSAVFLLTWASLHSGCERFTSELDVAAFQYRHLSQTLPRSQYQCRRLEYLPRSRAAEGIDEVRMFDESVDRFLAPLEVESGTVKVGY